MARRTRDPVTRLLRILAMLPRAPKKISTRAILERLRAEGHEVTLRSVQRDLHRLQAALPLRLDDTHKPFGWSWERDADSELVD